MSRVVVAGSGGVVGRHVLEVAKAAGWETLALTRREADPRADRSITWEPARAGAEVVDEAALGPVREALEGAALVVNLAGSSIADGRFGAGHRWRVLESRVQATRALVRGACVCEAPPTAWVQASAVGYYGSRGDEELTEETETQEDWFLAEVCRRWEGELKGLEGVATRVVIGRLGVVLAEDAEAFQKMRLPVWLGVGGPLGSGRQWMSWIDAGDAARAILWLGTRAEAEGPYNLVAPEPVRQGDLAQQMAIVLHRPALAPAPAWVLRLVLGGLADQLLLSSARALPARLQREGFRFARPTVGRALVDLL